MENNLLTIKILEEVLDRALKGRLCVQAWLGYGEALFVGLGERAMPSVPRADAHAVPPWELQTYFADWTVSVEQGAWDKVGDKPLSAEESVNRLVGCHAVAWRFHSSPTNLEVSFEQGLRLSVTAWPVGDMEPQEKDSDAWALRTPDGTYFAVSCSGNLSSEAVTLPTSGSCQVE